MPDHTSTPKQLDKAASPHAGWLTRAQVAAELGYRSIFPIRKMEGSELHPVRDPRGWLFDPAEVAALKAKRPIGGAGAPVSEGRIAARVFYLFDKGRELREIVEELEIAPGVVRDLWHDWLMDLDEGEENRRKSAQEERKRRAEENQLRELERRNEQEQQNFEKIMAAMAGATGSGGGK
jgi:glycine/D-amino acid oxidase-like deaminating enzyme